MGFLLPHMILFFFFIFLLNFPPLSSAQTNGNITVGVPLTATAGSNSSWLSSSREFAFGFKEIAPNSNLFLLCIWYDILPEKTIVWYPKDTTPAPLGSKVELTPDKETNFSLGRFQLRLLPDGNVCLNPINLPTDYANEAYYTSHTPGKFANDTEAGLRLVFDESGSLYVLRQNGKIANLSSGAYPPSQYYHRVKLNFDGVAAHYVHLKDTSTPGWTPVWSQPENICKDLLVTAGLGVCGYNSICNIRENARPTCSCPAGFTFIDPNDHFSSCAPNFAVSCDEAQRNYTSDLFTFEEAPSTDWPTSDYALLTPFTEQQCRNSCLNDCFCAVAIFKEGKECWKKKLPLSHGQTGWYLSLKALIKVPKRNLPPDRPMFPPPNGKDKSKKDKLFLTGSVLFGTSVLVNILLVGVICLGFYWIRRSRITGKLTLHQSEGFTKLQSFTYKELVEATNGFTEELGRGHFGIVYRGMISNSPVAVKKLINNLMQESEKEFRTEVNVIGQTHHKNLVRLLGYCDEGHERLLVYEFLSNGSLSSLLFGNPRPTWAHRCQIALGIARGLLYLHEECSTQIIHCDIKPQNILLDDQFAAKISDFGLAKLLQMGQSLTHTGIRGTKGYVAPEWFRYLPVTVKVDVYSFGVLLLEIVCCKKNIETEIINEEAGERMLLSDWAYDCYVDGVMEALVEGDMEALSDEGGKKLKRMVMVGIWCIQEDPSLRPSMRKVTQMLEGAIEVPVPPCPFPFMRM
ncbi:hypothetical protein CDL15_Pgr025432 [Punica granatum]|uniref:non-specific serine/threonine protein kinase n=1 Tax=Punica granatum TaxID=22663 RepID=A0A218W8Y3_PUNGR|nr:hypothetical protein CDL15_Pgr025432 [Punica granatum]